MDTLSGFWAGAVALSSRHDLGPERARLDLHELARRCGGWNAMQRMTADQLVAKGLAHDAARVLTQPTPLYTTGAR